MKKVASKEENTVPFCKEVARAEAIGQGFSGFFTKRQIALDPKFGLPIEAYACGARAAGRPALMVVGGVHGLEKIGSALALDFMESLAKRAQWDDSLSWILSGMSVHIIPAANPAGLAGRTRSNGMGVDLMRNAPQGANGAVPFLAGGHHLGPMLPWYRGRKGAPMQPESKALIDYALEVAMSASKTIVLDCHSGYGFGDGLWFPYAKSGIPSPVAGPMLGLAEALESSLPHHGYSFEPQSKQYLAHGDLWDYALDLSIERGVAPGAFCPLTLEMGSWSWIKKSPRQLFSAEGLFNPVLPHRHARVLRRHAGLLDFLMRAARSGSSPVGAGPKEASELRERAVGRWWKVA